MDPQTSRDIILYEILSMTPVFGVNLGFVACYILLLLNNVIIKQCSLGMSVYKENIIYKYNGRNTSQRGCHCHPTLQITL